ncbi:hypothetical protein TPHA_0D03250 [Tetrapisispora phaffii CBS 4417]|uniref:Uncharacterized protein n=1 Tax=Tetrapisispora phaffii (strain ATCC 24235 / CBS 4417 / NBRC 1672 / NRRL Y-8282 / UCD 70-5) TaxID=1071381 RepID=G8BSZ0_TETPH|nr:hypothetical protein TPHA_0D03250 [Tetrapisispora phaffii CBS 4417]CCE62961.1 hypothetical protein TPHA_0D03250 [Tetrapisispora phaffii CBS 4417]
MVTDNYSKSTTDSENFDDVSSFNSDNSYTPQEFIGDTLGKESSTKMDDRASHLSHAIKETRSGTSDNNTIKPVTSNDVHRIVSRNIMDNNVESEEALKTQLTNMESRRADIILPASMEGNSNFPEEYTMETTTGLVPVKTLEDIKKKKTIDSENSRKSLVSSELKASKSNNTVKSRNEGGLNPAKLNAAVEKNKEELEKYQHHKTEKNPIKKMLFKLFY